ncbi:hypothetical protein D3218_03145 [Aureimonas flava]|uniref:Alpha/beta hydrolase n=1 Tax=Aureimonas flava TaxID=2320271 RepID=A0A3A1WPB9_9HYPH|nr:hypothetical protein D3218_03145 [Aureimonas flava]
MLGLAVGLLCAATASRAEPFAPFRDELFAYPQPVASLDDGRRLDVPYSEERDIDRRDEIPERRVRRAYVELRGLGAASERTLRTPDGLLRFATLGASRGGSTVLVFVHGRNGDRRLGLNDWSFGGNFNRLKNLLVRAGGTYVTVDGGRLDDADAGRVGLLLRELRREHPASTLILACASMGGQICWSLATSNAAPPIDAMVLLGTDSAPERFRALRSSRPEPMPVLIAHGTRDKVYAFDRQLAAYRSVRAAQPTYPIRFVGFEDGNHGTPIRMVDWRDTLNWIAGAVRPPGSP